MPILNFKEIPEAHIANGLQDTFELFARDFINMIGLSIISGPDRGQDGGRDLLAIEKRGGIVGTTEIKWLISCKHKAHSGQSVKDGDEVDIIDRVRAHGAHGFIGFYSTIVSSPLCRKFEGLKNSIEIKIFDNELIEHELLNSPIGQKITSRYFPSSFLKLTNSIHFASNILTDYHSLNCRYCGKDLLNHESISKYSGIVAFVNDRCFKKENDYEKEHIIDVYWACKGRCDNILQNKYRAIGGWTGWEDISDIIIPSKYLDWNISIMNRLRDGSTIYKEEAYNNLREFIVRVSQFVLRQQTDEQISRYNDLLSLPDWL